MFTDPLNPAKPYDATPPFMVDTTTMPEERKNALRRSNKVFKDMVIPTAIGLNNTVHNTALFGDMLRHIGTDITPFISSEKRNNWHKLIDADSKSTIASKERLNQAARDKYYFKTNDWMLPAAEGLATAGITTGLLSPVIGKIAPLLFKAGKHGVIDKSVVSYVQNLAKSNPALANTLMKYYPTWMNQKFFGTITGLGLPLLDKAVGFTGHSPTDSKNTKKLKTLARTMTPVASTFLSPGATLMGLGVNFANPLHHAGNFLSSAILSDGYLRSPKQGQGIAPYVGNAVMPGIKKWWNEPFDPENLVNFGKYIYNDIKTHPGDYQNLAYTVARKEPISDSQLAKRWKEHVPNTFIPRLIGLRPTMPLRGRFWYDVINEYNRSVNDNKLWTGNFGTGVRQGAYNVFTASPEARQRFLGEKGLKDYEYFKSDIQPWAKNEIEVARKNPRTWGLEVLLGKRSVPEKLEPLRDSIRDNLTKDVADKLKQQGIELTEERKKRYIDTYSRYKEIIDILSNNKGRIPSPEDIEKISKIPNKQDLQTIYELARVAEAVSDIFKEQ